MAKLPNPGPYEAKWWVKPEAWAQAQPVPIIGPWLARVGYAADMLAMPCHPTPTAWAYGAFAAGGKAVASLIKPYPIAEAFRALSSGRVHGKRPRPGGMSGRGWGFLAALEELQPLVKAQMGSSWNAWVIPADLAVKAMWYLYVMDVTTDGLINWISQAYAYQGCIDPQNLWYQGTAATGGIETSPPQDHYYFAWHTDPASTLTGELGTILIPPGYNGGLAACISWSQLPNLKDWQKNDPDYKCPLAAIYIKNLTTGRETDFRRGQLLADGTGSALAVMRIRAHKKDPQVLMTYINKGQGILNVTGGYICGTASPDMKDELFADP